MGSSYIPSREADMDAWLLNFKTLIAATPTNYGLVAGDATSISAAYAAWNAAYLAATNPTTRTRLTVQTKNQQKANVLSVVRGYAATIRANRAVSDALKMGLGLHIHDSQPTPIPAPSTYPVLTVRGLGLGAQDLNAADQMTPDKRAKPAGAIGLVLFRAIGTAPISNPDQAAYLAFVTRAEFQSQFTSADNGKTATYFARWTNGKGEVGPWSPPASMPIAA